MIFRRAATTAVAGFLLRLFTTTTTTLFVAGSDARSDSFYANGVDTSNTMWVIGRNGVEVFSVDGKRRLRNISSDNICRVDGEDDNGKSIVVCNFREAISDGHRHVWALNNHKNENYLEVFNIRTGMHVASLPVCDNPVDLQYAPFREEIYVHCWRRLPDDAGKFLVYNTNHVGIEHRQLDLNNPADPYGTGYIILDAGIPNSAIVTLTNANYIQFADLNSRITYNRHIFSTIEGFGQISFSDANKHLFARTIVCCPCQNNCNEDARDITVTAGPMANETVLGFCGTRCYGTEADDVGVMEIDTHLDNEDQAVVAIHKPAMGFGADPYTTPDGQLTFLLGYDGGQKVTVLRHLRNMEASQVAGVIDLDFSTEMGFRGVSDICFIMDASYDLVAFSSTLSNRIVIVDINEYRNPTISNTDLPMVSIDLEGPEYNDSSAHRNSKRNLVWAPGTRYLWVDSNKLDEVHIIEINALNLQQSKLHETISNLVSRKIIYVNNYDEHSIGPMTSSIPDTKPPLQGTQTALIRPSLDQLATQQVISQAVDESVQRTVANLLPTQLENTIESDMNGIVERGVDQALDGIVDKAVQDAFSEREAQTQNLIDDAIDTSLKDQVYPRIEGYKINPNQKTKKPSNATLSVAAVCMSILAVVIGLLNFYTMTLTGGRSFRASQIEVNATDAQQPFTNDIDSIDLQ